MVRKDMYKKGGMIKPSGVCRSSESKKVLKKKNTCKFKKLRAKKLTWSRKNMKEFVKGTHF